MTAGSTSTTCDNTRTFVAYASTTFTAEADNGKYVCYRAVDAYGNTGYLNSTVITGIDRTPPTITITQPDTSPATSKTITASASDGTLTMTAGSTSTTCDNTRTFVAYASTTFTAEADNGKYVCYRAVDVLGNTGYLNSTVITGIDRTPPPTPTCSPGTSTFGPSGVGVTCSSSDGTIKYTTNLTSPSC